MSDTTETHAQRLIPIWIYLLLIMILAFSIRITGIWRTESIDYYPDEDKIGRPVLSIANYGRVGMKRDYNWPMCGIIYPLGYILYGLKGLFGEYSYTNILVIQRVLSAIIGTGVVLAVFLLMRKIFYDSIGLISASLVAIGKLPVNLDHDGYLRSSVSLITVIVMILCYDLFDITKDESTSLKTGKSCFLGFVCGWGVAVRWTMLLTSIPISGAFLLSYWFSRKLVPWKDFLKINLKKILIIAAIAILSFLAGNPDFQFDPQKVLSGILLQKKQGNLGHYGDFADRSDSLGYNLSKLSENMSLCGSIYLFIPGILATIACFVKPTRPKIFLLWTMTIWLIVLYRNVLPFEKYHLMPFIIMLLLIAIGIVELSKRYKRSAYILFGFIMIMGTLYTLIWISPQWKTDARLKCSAWIRSNIDAGNGITWAPRTHKWMLPGIVVDPELFKLYPRVPEQGKTQYILASKQMVRKFKRYPPGQPINPDDWFPAKPPTMNELILYAEMNNGGGPHLNFVKEFSTKSSFLGLDLRLFGQDPTKDTSRASHSVDLFSVKSEAMKNKL